MKNKKGFTLIELLAVIVVLAIIALIATPLVLNLVNKAKEGAAEASGYVYINSVETSIVSYMLKNNGNSYSAGKYDISTLNTDLGVSIKGDKPTEGKVCVSSDGNVTKASLKISGYIVSYDGKKVKNTDLKEVEDIKCDSVVGGPTQVLSSNGETYKAIVYLDPTDLTKTCDASNSVSTTGTKEGCMKWYVYSDDGTNYTMILDHNTTVGVQYNSFNNNTKMQEVAESLTTDTLNWTSGLNPRLIKADEVAQITGAIEALSWVSNKTFTYNLTKIGDEIAWFYLDGAAGTDATWQTPIATSEGASNYAWLFDYTSDCKDNGCNLEDSNPYGYWTSTPVTNQMGIVWYISKDGVLTSTNANWTANGIRPVITISKSIVS